MWRLNAAAFGVPQGRIRCFLVASRLPLMPARPTQEYQDTSKPDTDLDALPAVSLAESIFDLPPREAGPPTAGIGSTGSSRSPTASRHAIASALLVALQPEAFQRCFRDWIAGLEPDEVGPSRLVAVDGKTCRRSHDTAHGLGPLHVVSAWRASTGSPWAR